MPDIPFASEVVREMKAKPYTMLVIVALSATVPYIVFNYAKADDLLKLTAYVQRIDTSIQHASLDAQIRAISTELFTLKQKVLDMQAAHKPVDQLYMDRIVTLESDKAQAERELAALGK